MLSRSVLAVLLAGCNTPPGSPGLSFTPEAPSTLEDLVVSVVSEAEDPNKRQEVTYRYAWTVDGALVDDLTGETTVPADRTTRDEVWAVSVTAWDGKEAGEAMGASVTILNTPPTAASIEPTTPTSADDLSCIIETADVDSDAVETTVAWIINEAPAGEGEVLSADAISRDDTVWCEVTPDDGTDAGELYADTAARDAGEAYLILGSATPTDGELTSQAATLLGSAANDNFPSKLSGSDIDGDGYSDILSSSYKEDTLARDGGCVFIEAGPVSGVISAADTALKVCGVNDYDYLINFEVTGDMDGDGEPDFAVASSSHDSSSCYSAGVLYLFFELP